MTWRGWPRNCRKSARACVMATGPGYRRQGVRVGPAVQQGRPEAVRRSDAAAGTNTGRQGRRSQREEGCARRARRCFFTIPHFDGFSAVLIQFAMASEGELREAVTDA